MNKFIKTINSPIVICLISFSLIIFTTVYLTKNNYISIDVDPVEDWIDKPEQYKEFEELKNKVVIKNKKLITHKDHLKFIGSIHNNTGKPLRFFEMTLSIYDKNNSLIDVIEHNLYDHILDKKTRDFYIDVDEKELKINELNYKLELHDFRILKE